MQEFTPATRFEEMPVLDMRFPPLPRTVAVVSKLLSEQSEIPDMQGLVEAVNADPVVAASVLRRINSAYYGMRRRVADIRKAVFLLGFLEVSNMVLTEGMLRLRSVVRSEEQVHIFEQIMRASVGAASYAQEIAVHLSLARKATAFTGGILHAVGRLVLLFNKPADYEALWWTSERVLGPTVESEQLIFGTDHVRLGTRAADRWQLPEEIIELIGHTPNPGQIRDTSLRTLGLTVAIGISAVEQFGFEPPEDKPFSPPSTLYALARATGVPPTEIIDVIENRKVPIFNFINEVVGVQEEE